MKALNLYGVNDLRYEEVPMPICHEDEVLLKIRACGICGSDIPRVFSKGTYHFPTIIGHEFAGEIVSAADKSLVGKKASVFPLIPCGTCPACQTGHYAQCSHYSYYGSRQDGAMAEYLAVKENNLCLMPEGVSFEETGVHAGGSLLIYGVGAIGLILAQFARAAGIEKIILIARTDDKVQFARKLGFPLTCNAIQENIRETVAEWTDGNGADACVEGTGTSEGLEECLWNAKAFGVVVTLGNPVGSMTLTQDGYWKILRKELRLIGTWNSSFSAEENDWKGSLAAMQNKSIDLKSLITHRFVLRDYRQAFSMMHEKKEMYCKVMFVMDGKE